MMATTRSSSPAMQASSAGLAVTMSTTSPAFSSLSGLQSTISNINNTTTSSMYSLNYPQPTTYASTNPFLTGAYLSYTPGESNKPFSYLDTETTKYSTLNPKNNYDSSDYTVSSEQKFNTIGGKSSSSYLSTNYNNGDLKYHSGGNRDGKTNYEVSPNVTQSGSSVLLGVEETPTPTSSIETEDSNTREVGEKDVEGDGEQSD